MEILIYMQILNVIKDLEGSEWSTSSYYSLNQIKVTLNAVCWPRICILDIGFKKIEFEIQLDKTDRRSIINREL